MLKFFRIPFILLFFSFAFAQRTDVVVLVNGDHITGEIEELKYAKLDFNTDAAERIFIEWNKIASLKSKHTFIVATQYGGEYFGSIDTDTATNQILIITEDDTVQLARDVIVEIIPVKNRFWSPWGGTFRCGTRCSKAKTLGRKNSKVL